MSLNTSLNIAVQALQASTGALQATNNNIANANTPGYSRQQVQLQEAATTSNGQIALGNGVVLAGFQSVRSELLQRQIASQTSTQSSADTQLTSLQQIESSFTTSTQDIGTQLSALFSSLSALSTNPADSNLRQSVLSAGSNLASAFNTVANSLTNAQTGLNTQTAQDVTQINSLTQQIAALQPQLAALKASGQDGGSVQDQSDQLLLSLSRLTTVDVTQTENGPTLTTGNGTPLVVGGKAFALSTTTGTDGLTHVLDTNGTDITSTLTGPVNGGDLGGSLQTQTKTVPGLLTQLDTLANQLGTAFNSAQAAGFDQSGTAGSTFFTLPATVAGSAAHISFALTASSQIAASSNGASGSSGNLATFAAIESSALPSGATPGDTYASLVFQAGSLTANAQAESTATAASLQQLQTQQSSLSGVSIDEESTNLIRFQQSYEAAARVVSVISSLFDVTMSMGTNAAA